MVLANAIPKQASASARGQAVLRSAGWSGVLGALGYVLAWLLLPLTYAYLAAVMAIGLGLLYALMRVVWLCRRPAAAEPPG